METRNIPRADAQAKAGASGKALGDLYFLASDYCRVGRYPVASTPGKKQAYAHSVRMFRKAAEHFDMPLIRRIVNEASKNDYRFSSLVLGIVKSEPFQMNMRPASEQLAARQGN